MEKYDIQSETQRKAFDLMPHFFLDQEEQANFHFMMHMRLLLNAPEFMATFERDLFEKKLADLQAKCPDLANMDCADTFIKMKSYDLSNMDRNTFQCMINDASNPPIIAKGYLNDTKAVQQWTHEYLIEHYKDTEIIAVGYDEKETSLKKLKLEKILRSQLDKDSKVSYYINNSAEIFNDYPDLIDEVGAEKILDLFHGHSANSFSQLFVGNLRTWGTNWHQGNDISCALMISGVKRWYFVDPRLGYILRPFFDGANGMSAKMDARLDINFHKIHSPLYAYAPKFYVDLEPGDVIFFTKYWPHAVINTTPLQIMANMRMTEVNLDTMTKGKDVPTLMPVYDNILNSDPSFIKFKFDIFNNLGKKSKTIGDENYFSAYTSTSDILTHGDKQ